MRLALLWDASELWGCLALWALRSLGLPHTLVRARDVAAGLPADDPPSLLLVPGGLARRKAAALGPAGLEAVRAFVASGGRYLGFCGGAGLGLSGTDSLNLCPWQRGAYADHRQHLMSGHLGVTATPHRLTPPFLPASPLLPVWWPGRFDPERAHSAAGDGVTILARYAAPGPDFRLADLPVASLPDGLFNEGEARHGSALSPAFLEGQPCIVHGAFGRGSYTLSYSHLETPDSEEANVWFAHLLRELGGFAPEHTAVPAWTPDSLPTLWEEAGLVAARAALLELLDTGCRTGLFFRRTPWLLGRRSGLPGAALATLRAQLCTLLSREPTRDARRFWREKKGEFLPLFAAFLQRSESYLLAERPAMTPDKAPPDAPAPDTLAAERAALFGNAMSPDAGGLYRGIFLVLEELVFLQCGAQSH